MPLKYFCIALVATALLGGSVAAAELAIIQPPEAASFTPPQVVTIAADVSADLAAVDVYADGTRIATVHGTPYIYSWVNPGIGTHWLTLRATAISGLSVTSAPVRINIAATNDLPDERKLLSSIRPGLARDNFSGWVGMTLQVGAEPLIVSALGRWSSPGNQHVHAVKLVRASDRLDLPGGAVILPPPTSGDAFQYGSLPQPVVLEAGRRYHLVSEETEGEDAWYDLDSTVISRPVAQITGPVYFNSTFLWRDSETPNHSYGPVDLKYRVVNELHLGDPLDGASIVSSRVRLEAEGTVGMSKVEFYRGSNKLGQIVGGPYSFTWTNPPAGDHSLRVVGTTTSGLQVSSPPINVTVALTNALDTEKGFLRCIWLSNPRNDLNVSVGAKITIGARPVIVTQLGRWVIPGNSGAHLLKLVEATTGKDVVNGATTVATAGASPDAFAYAKLPSPVILRADTSYYLVSEETRTLDVWGDSWSRVTPYPQSVARVQSAVSTTNGIDWQTGPQNGRSYGPLDFKYSSAELRIVSPRESESVIGPAPLLIQAEVEPGMTTVEFFDEETKLGQVDQSPYTFTWPNPTSGTHHLKLKALRSDRSTATSTPVQIEVAVTNALDIEKTFVRQIDSARAGAGYWSSSGGSTGPGLIGAQITVSSRPLVVTALGRWIVSGNANRHLLKIVRASDQTDVPGARVNIDTAQGLPNGFKYERLPRPVVLAAGLTYYLVSEEVRQFALGAEPMLLCRDRSALQTEEEASLSGEVISTATLDWSFQTAIPANDFKFMEQPGPPRISIVSPNSEQILFTGESAKLQTVATGLVSRVSFFQDNVLSGEQTAPPYDWQSGNLSTGEYTFRAEAVDVYGSMATSQVVRVHVIPNNPAASFLSSTVPGRLRNDFDGLLGMYFTVGSTPVAVTSLGRMIVAGNTEDHLVQLWLVPVDGNLNNTILAGEASVSSRQGVAGEYLYQNLTHPLMLLAGRSYFLTSAERSGGDQWHETDSEVVPRSVGTVAGAAYFQLGRWTAVTQANRIYVPVNFQFIPGTLQSAVALRAVRAGNESRLLLSGQAGQTYRLEMSVDLKQWEPAGLVQLTTAIQTFPAPQPNDLKRFYRIAP